MSNESRKKIKKDTETGFGIDSKQPNQSRRSFAKAGIIAPVIMSLANRPAWGDVTHRCNVSGWASVPVVGEGSGIPPNSDICGFASASTVFDALDNSELNKNIATIFDCFVPPEGTNPSDTKVSNALRGDFGFWVQYMMTTYYHEFPEKAVGLVVSGNPLGCPVVVVFCDFAGGADRVDFGNISLTQPEVEEYLDRVIPLPTFS